MAHMVEFLVRHGYVVLFFWVLGEQAALPLPAVPMLLACGAVAHSGRLQVAAVLMTGVLACLIADNVWFQLGRRRGARIVQFICRIALEPDSCVRQTKSAFHKYGMRSLLIAKFVPGLNAVAAPLAGSSHAPLARFLLFEFCGSALWVSAYVSAGYVFSGEIEMVMGYAMRMGSWLVLLVLGLLSGWIAWKFFQRRRFLKKLAIARITAQQLRAMLDNGEELMIVDVRNHFAGDAESIPGALRIPADELAERHAEIPRDRDIVLFCS